jgi:hypothetical protein
MRKRFIFLGGWGVSVYETNWEPERCSVRVLEIWFMFDPFKWDAIRMSIKNNTQREPDPMN